MADANLSALQTQITNDPRVRAILAAPDVRGHGTTPGSREAKLWELSKALLPEGYYIQADGTVTKKAPAWLKYLGPAVVAGGGAGLAALGAAAPAALGAGEAATTLGATGGIVPGLAAAAPVVAPVAGAGVPAAAAGRIWSRLAPSLIGMGAQAVASGLTAWAAGKAADQQSAAADKALALQRDIFNQTQANQRPFIDVGTGAATRLNSLMGGGPLSSLGGSQTPAQGMPQQQAPQMVQMRAPDGSIKAVPFTEVPHWEQMKAVRVF